MGPQIKYDRNLGGRWRIAVSIGGGDVMLFSNNDVILLSEGEGVKKELTIAAILNVYLMYGP